MDEQLKKELKELIDDAILKASTRVVCTAIDMVNEQLRANNVDMTFKCSVGKTGIIVENTKNDYWQLPYPTTIESIEFKELK